MAQPVGVHGGLYRGGLGLLTDLYQISMAAGYHRAGLADRPAVFHLSFRTAPFGGRWAVAAGLETVAELLEAWRFDAEDLDFLAGLQGADGEPLLPPPFLHGLGQQRMRCDVDIVPEGTVVFPHGPLLRVRGPLAQAQLLETPLLTLMNFQTLIATKAARMRLAAGFPEAAVVASNDLDEHEILRLKSLGAPIAVWGVGTRLATGHDQSALGGVYKLGALQGTDGEWQDRVKLSEQPIKVSIPGMLQVRRRLRLEDGLIDGDLIYDERDPAPPAGHRDDHDLLIPVLRGGVRVAEPVSIHAARARTLAGLARLTPAVRAGTEAPRLELSPEVDARRSALIAAARGSVGGAA